MTCAFAPPVGGSDTSAPRIGFRDPFDLGPAVWAVLAVDQVTGFSVFGTDRTYPLGPEVGVQRVQRISWSANRRPSGQCAWAFRHKLGEIRGMAPSRDGEFGPSRADTPAPNLS